jgi:hypothetical protein
MNAPATAPIGPSTTAPDTAPKAALPARSCALALNEKNVAAITAATSSFFIVFPLDEFQGTALQKCGDRKVAPRQPPFLIEGIPDDRFKKPATGNRRGLSNFLRR